MFRKREAGRDRSPKDPGRSCLLDEVECMFTVYCFFFSFCTQGKSSGLQSNTKARSAAVHYKITTRRRTGETTNRRNGEKIRRGARDISKQQTENIPSTSSSELDLPGSFGDLSRPISLSLSKHTRKEMKMNTQEKRSK